MACRHLDTTCTHGLGGQRIHREGMLRVHRAGVGPQEGAGCKLEDVVRAIAEHDLIALHPEARGQGRLQAIAIAVGIQGQGFQHVVHGLQGVRTDAERILVGGQLDDLREAQLTLQLGSGLTRLVRGDGADVRCSQITQRHDGLTL